MMNDSQFITIENVETTVKIKGFNASIYSLEEETDGLILVNSGNLVLKGLTLKGPIETISENVVLDDVNILVNTTYFDYCLSATGEVPVTIYRTCISNASPDLDTINLKGGNFIWNEDFVQY